MTFHALFRTKTRRRNGTLHWFRKIAVYNTYVPLVGSLLWYVSPHMILSWVLNFAHWYLLSQFQVVIDDPAWQKFEFENSWGTLSLGTFRVRIGRMYLATTELLRIMLLWLENAPVSVELTGGHKKGPQIQIRSRDRGASRELHPLSFTNEYILALPAAPLRQSFGCVTAPLNFGVYPISSAQVQNSVQLEIIRHDI